MAKDCVGDLEVDGGIMIQMTLENQNITTSTEPTWYILCA
jgi:hypothetical protein